MNKQKFVELMRSPDRISGRDCSELQKVLNEYPYFQGGYTVLAKGCKNLKVKSSQKIISRAAIYATDRNVFKDFLLGKIKQKAQPAQSIQATRPKTQPASQNVSQTASPTSTRKAPQLMSQNEQDRIIKEIYDNLEQWKVHRDEYLEFDKAHPEDIIIEDPFANQIEPQTVQDLKNQVAEEVKAEDIEVEQQIKKFTQPPATDPETSIEPKTKEEGPSDVAEDIIPPETTSAEAPSPIESIKPSEPEPTPEPISDISLEQPVIEMETSDHVTTEEEKIISTEELSAIVDETEADMMQEDVNETGTSSVPDIQPLSRVPQAILEAEGNDLEDLTPDPVSEKDIEKITFKAFTEDGDENVDIQNLKQVEEELEAEAAAEMEAESVETAPQQEESSVAIEASDEEEINILERPEENIAEEEKPDEEEPKEEEEMTAPEPETEPDEVNAEEAVEEAPSLEVKAVESLDSIDLDDVKEIGHESSMPSTDVESGMEEFDSSTTTSDNEEELDRITHEKEELKLQLGQSQQQEKKFRLSIMKRPIKFTKEKKTKKDQSASKAAPKPDKKKPAAKKTTKTAKTTSTGKSKTSTKKKSSTLVKATKSTKTKKSSPDKGEDEKKKS